MTTTLALGIDRPRFPRDACAPHGADRAPRDDSPRGAGASRGHSLDDLVVGVWEALASHHTVTCPVCSGTMAPRYGSGARPVGGRCRRCGSSLG